MTTSTARQGATGLLALQAVAAVGGGVGFVVAALVRHPADRGTAVLLGALLTLFGVGIGFVARGVARDRRWAQTPAYLIQFFSLVVAWYQRGTLPAVAATVAVVAVATAAALTVAARQHPSGDGG